MVAIGVTSTQDTEATVRPGWDTEAPPTSDLEFPNGEDHTPNSRTHHPRCRGLLPDRDWFVSTKVKVSVSFGGKETSDTYEFEESFDELVKKLSAGEFIVGQQQIRQTWMADVQAYTRDTQRTAFNPGHVITLVEEAPK